MNKGYSLIELLIVISLIGILGTITSEIFILGLRLQAKSEIVKEVKQNGDYASAVIESMIRSANDFQGMDCNQDYNYISILNPDGNITTFLCEKSDGIGILASKSGEISDPFAPKSPLTNNKVYVDSDPNTDPNACTFRVICPDPPLSPKYALINFTIRQKGAADNVEQTSTQDFQMVVSLRKYD